MDLPTEAMTATRIGNSNGTPNLIVSAYCKTAKKFLGIVSHQVPSPGKPYEALLPNDKIGDLHILENPNETIAIINVKSCGCSGRLQSSHPSSGTWDNLDLPRLESSLIQGGKHSLR